MKHNNTEHLRPLYPSRKKPRLQRRNPPQTDQQNNLLYEHRCKRYKSITPKCRFDHIILSIFIFPEFI